MGKIIPILAITIMISSCGVSTKITYGDISVLTTEGVTIRQWDNCTMDITVKDNYSGEYISTSYSIKDGGGLAFTDNSGETHYVNGGIIIVDNIQTKGIIPVNEMKNVEEKIDYKSLETEYKQLKKMYSTNKKTLKNLKGEEASEINKENKNISERMKELEGILQKHWASIYYNEVSD